MSDLLSGEPRRVPITDQRLRNWIACLVGMRAALKVLEEEGRFAKGLAGMAVARTLIEAEVSTIQTQVYERAVRLAVKAGVDLSAWQIWSFEVDAIVCRPFEEVPEEQKDAPHA